MDPDVLQRRLPSELLQIVASDYGGLANRMALRIQRAYGNWKGWRCRDCWRTYGTTRRLMGAMTCDMATGCCLKLVCRDGCHFFCSCGTALTDLCPQTLLDEPDETGYTHIPNLYLRHCRHASRWVECPDGCGEQVFVHRHFSFVLWLPFR
jgi:hypothetical protein